MVSNDKSADPKVPKCFPREQRRWFYDSEKKELSTMIGNYNNVIGVFGSPKPQSYVKVGVENMMLAHSRHRWNIEYCN